MEDIRDAHCLDREGNHMAVDNLDVRYEKGNQAGEDNRSDNGDESDSLGDYYYSAKADAGRLRYLAKWGRLLLR